MTANSSLLTRHQLPVATRPLPVASCPSPLVHHQLPVTTRPLPVTLPSSKSLSLEPSPPFLSPVPSFSEGSLRDTLRIPIPTYHETVASRTVTTTARDTDSITLQAVSRVYSDSTFRAVVSGIDPRLDSLTLFRTTPTVTHTITNHITTTRSTPRWGLGITAGATASPHGLTPGITIGLTYRLWP